MSLTSYGKPRSGERIFALRKMGLLSGDPLAGDGPRLVIRGMKEKGRTEPFLHQSNCIHCGLVFVGKTNKKFCSDSCRVANFELKKRVKDKHGFSVNT